MTAKAVTTKAVTTKAVTAKTVTARDEDKATQEQVVLLDVGNTHAVFGVLQDGELSQSFRVSTDRERTADEYGALLMPLFERWGLDPMSTEGFLISSVVPPLHPTLVALAERYFNTEAMFIEPGIRTGMAIRYDNPAEVGADRIVNAVAARELYGAPVVVVDFGTATTFDVINGDGEYAGGIIAPGISISSEALFAQASRLYRVDIRKPQHLVGRHTVGAMQSGIYYGYSGLVDGILKRLRDEIPGLQTTVATGGLATLIAEGSQYIQHVDKELTLIGLKLIYELNRKRR